MNKINILRKIKHTSRQNEREREWWGMAMRTIIIYPRTPTLNGLHTTTSGESRADRRGEMRVRCEQPGGCALENAVRTFPQNTFTGEQVSPSHGQYVGSEP